MFDIEPILFGLLVVGEQCEMELLPIFGHEQFRSGLLEVALRSTDSCCSSDREVG